MNRRLTYAAALPLALTLTLAGCSGDGSPAETVTVVADAGDADAADGDADTAEEDEDVVEPAAHQVIEIGEEKSYSGEFGAYTLTVHRATVQDYYVEAEITIINDSDRGIGTWHGADNCCSPRLYDDRGRTYRFQVQPGGSGQTLRLEPGEGINAVLAFAGRVDPAARQLKLDFTDITDYRNVEWNQMIFDIPLAAS